MKKISEHEEELNKQEVNVSDEYIVKLNNDEIFYVIDAIFCYRKEIRRDFFALSENSQNITCTAYSDFFKKSDRLIVLLKNQLTEDKHSYITYKNRKDIEHLEEMRWNDFISRKKYSLDTLNNL